MFFNGQKMKQVFAKAKKERFGIIASNAVFDAQLRAFTAGYNAAGADGLVQMSSGACKYAAGESQDMRIGAKVISGALKEIASQYSKSGVGLNVDHGSPANFDWMVFCIENGLVSNVMIDASHEDFEENIRISSEMVKIAHKNGVIVEGEIGYIKGDEDELVSEGELYTKPDEALEYVKKTKVDLFAASVGTNHGVTKGSKVVLRIELIKEIDDLLIKNGVETGLVLHGASGLTIKQQQDAVKNGVVKINKDTHYQMEFAAVVQKYWEGAKDAIVAPVGVSEEDYVPDKKRFDPRKWIGKAEMGMQKVTKTLVGEVIGENKSILL